MIRTRYIGIKKGQYHTLIHLFWYNWTSYTQCMANLAEDNVTMNEAEPVILVTTKCYNTYFIIYCSIPEPRIFSLWWI